MEQQQISPEEKALRDRLAVAQTRLAEIAPPEKAAERLRLEQLRAETEATEIAARDAELCAKYGRGVRGRDWDIVSDPVGAVVVSRPARGVFRQLVDKGQDIAEADSVVAIKACLLHPDQATLQGYFDEVPGLVDRCTLRLVQLGGLNTGKSKTR